MAIPYQRKPPFGVWPAANDPNLIVWLLCNEESGNRVWDASQYKNDGTLTNGTTWVAANHPLDDGLTLSFDGTDDYVDLGTGTSLNPTAITITAWIYITSLAAAYTAVYTKTVAGLTAYHSLFITSSGKVGWFVQAGGAGISIFAGTYTVAVNTWTHVAATYDSVTGLKTYVNGLINETGTANGNLDSNSANTVVGTDTVTSGRLFPGKMIDVRAYNRALTAGEIYKIFIDPYSDMILQDDSFADYAVKIYTVAQANNFLTLLGAGA